MQVSFGSRLREGLGRLARGQGSHRVNSPGLRACSWLAAGLLAGALAISPWSAWRVGWFGSRAQAAASSPGLSLAPSSGVANPGATFAVDIIADCGSHADAAAITVSFDPVRLQVVTITPDTSQFPNALLPASYDNVAGLVRYEAGSLTCHGAGSCPSGSVHLGTIQFSTIGQCGFSVPLALTGQLTWAGGYVFNGTGSGSTIAITIAGDVNANGQVNVQDIQLVAAHWSSVQGEALYDARYDLDADGDIDVADIMFVAARWNQQCSS
jgi:hypothetical protein